MDFIQIHGYTASFNTTASFLPQAVKTIRTKNTSGISMFMYLLFTCGYFLWLLYGILTYNTPEIVANAITCGFASVILYYKIKY